MLVLSLIIFKESSKSQFVYVKMIYLYFFEILFGANGLSIFCTLNQKFPILILCGSSLILWSMTQFNKLMSSLKCACMRLNA